MDREMNRFLDKNGGVASVSEMAELLGLEEGVVRRWARENDVRRLGSTFAFDRETAAECADDLLAEDDGQDGEDPDIQDDDEDDEDDESDDGQGND
jgi:hypothetical protein